MKKNKPGKAGLGEFMRRREAAAEAYVRGDFAPLGAIAARRGAGTFFGPGGGMVAGAGKVYARYRKDSKVFEPVGKTHFTVLNSGVGGGLAYWTGIQWATAQIRGMRKPVPMNLRVTEIFRREGRTWKMIHRHADAQVAVSKK